MGNFVEYIDLKRDYITRRDEYLDAIDLVCQKAQYVDGEFVRQFESEFAAYCGVPFVSCVNSGTNAILLSMLATGIQSGDEVIIPANTFVATAWGPVYAGAKPVFVDCNPETWQIDPASIEKAVTPRTRAVIGVHLYGLPFDIDAVRAVTQRYGLLLIEDCAQAHGATYKGRPVGGLCDAGCFSFYPTKNLGAFGEAGCVATADSAVAQKIDSLKNHAADIGGDHSEIGFNMRMDGIQAAVLSVRLKNLDALNTRRRAIAQRYSEEIVNPLIQKQSVPEQKRHVYHLYVVTVDDRVAFMRHLAAKKVGCAIHYSIPCHLQKVFSHLGYKPGDLPNAEYVSGHCVSLPMYPELFDGEIDRVIEACNSYQGGYRL